MAEEEYEVTETSGGNPQDQRKKKMMLLGGAALIAFLAYQQGFFGSAEDDAAQQEAATLDLEETQQRDDQQRQAQKEMGGLEISGPSGDRAVEVMSVQIENLKEEQKKNRELINTLSQENKKFRTQMSNEMRSGLSNMQEILEEMSRKRVSDDFQTGIEAPPEDRLPMASDIPESSEEAGEDGEKKQRTRFSYQVFGNPQEGQRKTAKNETQSSARKLMNYNPAADSGSSEDGQTSTETSETSSASSDKGGQEASDGGEGAQDVAFDETQERYVYKDKEVAAGAHVDLVNLHGADCPVGGSLVKDAINEKVPVTMVIQGQLRGSNGESLDIGNAHVIGYCVGKRNSERARIKVQYLSYWGPDGKEQFIDIEGYVTDKRDNGMDVAGIYNSSRTESVLMASGAEGIKAMADIYGASQFTNTVSSEGNERSSFTGDVGKAGGAAFASGSLDRLTDMLVADAEDNVDFINIPAGIPMQLNTLKPFKVKVAKSEVELSEL